MMIVYISTCNNIFTTIIFRHLLCMPIMELLLVSNVQMKTWITVRW